MSTSASNGTADKPKFSPLEAIKPYLVPYYLTVAGVLGAATAGFVALIVVLILVATNFNLLGLIE